MVPQREKQRMKRLLSEAINVLCKASLPYRTKFTVEGLLGITLDDEEILLINIDELVESSTSVGTGLIEKHVEDHASKHSPSSKRSSPGDQRPRKRYKAAPAVDATPIKIEPDTVSDSEESVSASDIQSKPISRINTLKSRTRKSEGGGDADAGPSEGAVGSGIVMPMTGLAGVKIPETGRVWPGAWSEGQAEGADNSDQTPQEGGTPIKLENLEQTLQSSHNSDAAMERDIRTTGSSEMPYSQDPLVASTVTNSLEEDTRTSSEEEAPQEFISNNLPFPYNMAMFAGQNFPLVGPAQLMVPPDTTDYRMPSRNQRSVAGQPGAAAAAAEQRTFFCAVCYTQTTDFDEYDEHMRRAHNDNSHRCHICGKGFGNQYKLRFHTQQHERRYHCTLCPRKFGQKTSLNNHMRTHTGETPYKCPHCEKRFKSYAPRNWHIKRVHSDQVAAAAQNVTM